MATAYYMNFKKGHHGAKNRVGGHPTFLPNKKPWSHEDNDVYGFIMELWVDEVHLSIPNVTCIQFYQSIDQSYDPLPKAILIDSNGILNSSRNVLIHPDIEEWDVVYDKVEDPDVLPKLEPTLEFAHLFKSKLKGIDPWSSEANQLFLGQITEMPVGFNFGGMLCSFYLLSDGTVRSELH